MILFLNDAVTSRCHTTFFFEISEDGETTQGRRRPWIFTTLDEFYFTTAEKKILENCRCIPYFIRPPPSFGGTGSQNGKTGTRKKGSSNGQKVNKKQEPFAAVLIRRVLTVWKTVS